VAALVFATSGCLKTLDESRMDQTGGAGTTGGAGGAGASGGGSGGAPTGGSGGSSGSGGSAGYVAYDPTKYPVTKLWAGKPPIVMAADETDVYLATGDEADAALRRVPIAGGADQALPPLLEKPRAMSAPSTSAFVFVVGGKNTGSDGSVVRTTKAGGPKDAIAIAGQTPLGGRAVFAATDGFAYVTFDTDATHPVGLARFGLGSGVANATALYTASGAETSGAVVASGACVYWVSAGDIWVMPTGGGARVGALDAPVTDAVGLTADAANFYYTRGDGSVWARALSGSGCDGKGAAPKQLAAGFSNIGPVIRFKSSATVAWAARGDETQGYAGGGVFSMPAGGGTPTQIAPKESGPTAVADSPYDVVFATSTGELRKVPKPK